MLYLVLLLCKIYQLKEYSYALYNLTSRFFLLQFPQSAAELQKVPQSKDSAEKVPFITAALTHFGFYILMFLGFINQLFFVPKVARERNREVR